MGALIPIIIFVFITFLASKKVKDDKQEINRANKQKYAAYNSTSSYPAPTQKPVPRFDPQTGKPLVYQPPVYRNPVAAHLCDEGQHTEADRDYAVTLQQLEPGFRSYQGGYSGKRMQIRVRPMSAEERGKKKEELRDLLAAGIVSQAEYKEQMLELG